MLTPSLMSSSGLGKLREVVENNAGLLLVIVSQAFFASTDVTVQILMTGKASISVFEILFLRMTTAYICSVAYLYYAKIEYPILGPPEVRRLLACRAVLGFIGIWSFYFSLQYLSLSDTIVLTFLAPLCTALGGSLLLKERFTGRETLSGILGLLGVVLIARPPFIFGTAMRHDGDDLRVIVEHEVMTGQRMVAVGVVLISVLGQMGSYVSIRAAGERAHPLHIMAYFSALCVVGSITGMIIMQTPVVVPSEWPTRSMLLLICIFGFIAQMLMTKGFQIQAAGRASMGIYTEVIFALILERAVFGTVPQYFSMLGAVLVLGSAIYVAAVKEAEHDDDAGKIALPEEGLLRSHEDGD